MSPTPSPTPIPTPAPMPDGLTGSIGTYPSGLDSVLTEAADIAKNSNSPYGANLDAALEAAGIGVTSPWLPFAWTALAVITVLAVAALAVTVWKELRVGGHRNAIRKQRANDTTVRAAARAVSAEARARAAGVKEEILIVGDPVDLDAKDAD